eukprot:2499081-Pyramimonas_sp.AAC.1
MSTMGCRRNQCTITFAPLSQVGNQVNDERPRRRSKSHKWHQPGVSRHLMNMNCCSSNVSRLNLLPSISQQSPRNPGTFGINLSVP